MAWNRRSALLSVVVAAAVAAWSPWASSPVMAVPLDDIEPFTTTFIKDYLLISKSNNGLSTAISVTTTGNTLGHVVNLAPSAVALPSGVPSPVTANPTFDGDAAILTTTANFNYQDLNVFGDMDQGVVCASTTASCSNGGSNISNSKFNDNDGNGLQNFVAGRGLEQFSAGDLTAFTNEINAARTALLSMESLVPDQTIDLSGSGGTIGSNLFITLNNPGLNIISFADVGGDIKVDNSNLVFQAPLGATPGDRQAIVYLPDSANLLTSNGNIVVGESMGFMDVVFVSTRSDNASHFNFSNTVLNGVAFWDIFREVGATSDPSEHVWNNVTGCTQILGDKINLSSEIHLSNCGFRGVVFEEPDPGQIHGMKWDDFNDDGIKDDDEPGLPGWEIVLTSDSFDQPLMQSMMTDADGNYWFVDLMPGEYTISEVLQPGWTQTAPFTGSHLVSLTAGQVLEGLDFGNHRMRTEMPEPASLALFVVGVAGLGFIRRRKAT